MIKEQYNISSIQQLSSVALELLRLSDNRIFVLHGELGVGKTTLVKQFCHHLKVVETVSSPTFSLVNEYVSSDENRIFHFDLYRLDNVSELIKMGIDTYLNSGDYCFFEWPALVEPFLSETYTSIKITVNSDKRELYLLE